MKTIHVVFFIFLCIVWCGNASIWIKNVISYGPSAANVGVTCLSKMSQLYLNDATLTRSRTLVVAYTRNLSIPADNIQRMYLKWLHEAIIYGELDEMEIILISNAANAKKPTHAQSNTIYAKDYYVLIMDDFNKFNQLMRLYISRASFNPGAKFLILFTNPNVKPTNATQRELAYKLFRLMYDGYNAANVVLLYATDAKQYNIYVTNPYRNKTKCGSLRPVLLDTCQNGVLERSLHTESWVTEPPIPKVLPNCTFKFCARVAEPYINALCTTGLEIDIIHVLQQKLEFKINTFCTKKNRGEPLPNGSWSGILGMLRDDKCDFVVGGFFPDYDVHDDFGVTSAYLHDAYTWYVFVATFRPEWLAMLMIFKGFTWVGICMTLLVSGIVWYSLGRLTREKLAHGVPQLCALNSFSLLITHATNNRPLLTPLRILFVAMALFGMNITTIYSSKLIRIFTHPALEDQIDTVEEIITSRLPIGGRDEYKEWFNNEYPFDQTIYKMYDDSELFFSPTVENMADVAAKKRIILVNRNFVLSKAITDVYAMSFNVFASPLEMISERGFPLLRRFSYLIMFMRDAGIIEKLYDNFYYNMTTLRRIQDVVNFKGIEETNIVLTIYHLDGAFTLLILGLLISFVAFVVELILGAYKRRRQPAHLWKMVQNSLRQVSLMRSMEKKSVRNATKISRKWNASKKFAKKVKFNMSNDQVVKSYNW